ncbi:hypothetical protein ACFQ1S_06825, partial [Kibdelosporangium lantanae]
RKFTVMDTGGWEPTATGLQASVAAQAEYAMSTADAILLVVDVLVGKPVEVAVGPGRTGLAAGTEQIRTVLADLVGELDRMRELR